MIEQNYTLVEMIHKVTFSWFLGRWWFVSCLQWFTLPCVASARPVAKFWREQSYPGAWAGFRVSQSAGPSKAWGLTWSDSGFPGVWWKRRLPAVIWSAREEGELMITDAWKECHASMSWQQISWYFIDAILLFPAKWRMEVLPWYFCDRLTATACRLRLILFSFAKDGFFHYPVGIAVNDENVQLWAPRFFRGMSSTDSPSSSQETPSGCVLRSDIPTTWPF